MMKILTKFTDRELKELQKALQLATERMLSTGPGGPSNSRAAHSQPEPVAVPMPSTSGIQYP